MQWRALLLALSVLIGLGSWVWWSHQDEPASEESPLLERVFPDVEPGEVTRLTIAEGQRELVIERDDAESSRWRIVGEVPRVASEAHVVAAIRAAAELSSRRRFPAAGDGSSYGFSDLSPRVVLEGPEGVLVEFLLGSRLPVGSGRYVRIPLAPEVSVVSDEQLIPLEREPLDFRDRRVVGIHPDQLQSLRLSRGEGAGYTIDRSPEGGFTIVPSGDAPLFRADTLAVKDLLLDLAELSFRRIADGIESPGGTDQPTMTIELRSAQQHEAVLRFGGASPDGDRFVVASGDLLPTGVGDEIVLVAGDAFERLQVAAEELRSLELLDFDPGSVSSLSWSVRGLSGTLEHHEQRWRRSDNADPEVDADLVAGILAEFRAAKALQIVNDGLGLEEAGVETAQLSLLLRDGREHGLRLLRGAAGDYVVVDDGPVLWEVSADLATLFGRLSALSATSEGEEATAP